MNTRPTSGRYLTARPTTENSWDVVDVVAIELSETAILASIALVDGAFIVSVPRAPGLRSYFPDLDSATRFLETVLLNTRTGEL